MPETTGCPARCPRCEIDMGIHAMTSSEGVAYEVDVCARCSGGFLDGVELGFFSTILPGLARRRMELARSAARSSIGCPRCRGEMRMALVAGVTLDVCLACCGVWFDAGETAAVRRSANRPGAQTLRSATGSDPPAPAPPPPPPSKSTSLANDLVMHFSTRPSDAERLASDLRVMRDQVERLRMTK